MAQGITTDKQIKKAIREAAKAGKQAAHPITGYKGLELRIRLGDMSTTATFRHRYTHPHTAKRPYMTIGQYPAVTLEQARKAHHKNMALLAQRIDPMTHREQERLATLAAMNNGYADVAAAWLEHNMQSNPADNTLKAWKRGIKLTVEEWGDTPIKDITPPMVFKLCKRIQIDRPDTGKRVKSIAQRIFSYAVVQGLIDSNPARDIATQLTAHQVEHYPALTSPLPFAQLLRDIDAMKDSNERTALLLMALLFTRSGDMVTAKWADIDMDAALWTLAPQKGRGRSDMVDELIIPLPAQALALLKDQHAKTGMYEHVFFCHRRRVAPHMGTKNLNRALNKLRGGHYQGIHVPHGFRASAITMIQEQLKYPKELPDFQSGHIIKDNNGTAYNRVKFLDERRIMLQEWADYQDDLRAGKTVIRASFKKPKIQKLG